MIILDERVRVDLSTLESSYAIIINPYETSKNALYISDTLNEQIVYANAFRRETCVVKAGGTVIVRKHDNTYYCSGDIVYESDKEADKLEKEVRHRLYNIEKSSGEIWKYVDDAMAWVYIHLAGICLLIYMGSVLLRK